MIRIIIIVLPVIIAFSCSKETIQKEDIDTGVLCRLDERKYSDFCLPDFGIEYFIGYPDTMCFDSLLITLPGDGNTIRQFGNYPYQRTSFMDYLPSYGVYKIHSEDCNSGDSKPYIMIIDEMELEDPEEVNVQFYFYGDLTGTPTDSMLVLFKPWIN